MWVSDYRLSLGTKVTGRQVRGKGKGRVHQNTSRAGPTALKDIKDEGARSMYSVLFVLKVAFCRSPDFFFFFFFFFDYPSFLFIFISFFL